MIGRTLMGDDFQRSSWHEPRVLVVVIAAFITAVAIIGASLIPNDDDGDGFVPTEPPDERVAAPSEPNASNPATSTTTTTTPIEPSTFTLSDLEEEDAIRPHLFPSEGDIGTQRIKGAFGDGYPNGVSVVVFPDRSGVPQLELTMSRRAAQMHGYVGIDANALCPENDAKLSIEDERGRVLWEKQVSEVGGPRRFVVDFQRPPTELNLIQESLGAPNRCNGEANPAWAEVTFVAATAA